MLALAIGLVGCTSPESAFVGSPHGYVGRVDAWYADAQGAPSILQDGESPLHSNYGPNGVMADMPSTFSTDAAGNVDATGVAAYWMSRAWYCRAAPSSLDCSPVTLP